MGELSMDVLFPLGFYRWISFIWMSKLDYIMLIVNQIVVILQISLIKVDIDVLSLIFSVSVMPSDGQDIVEVALCTSLVLINLIEGSRVGSFCFIVHTAI